MVKFFSSSNGVLLAREINNWLASSSEISVVSIGYQNGYQNVVHQSDILYSALVHYETK